MDSPLMLVYLYLEIIVMKSKNFERLSVSKKEKKNSTLLFISGTNENLIICLQDYSMSSGYLM